MAMTCCPDEGVVPGISYPPITLTHLKLWPEGARPEVKSRSNRDLLHLVPEVCGSRRKSSFENVWRQSHTKTNIWYCLYLESKKNGTNEPIYKTEIESQIQKTNLWLPRERGGGMNWETGVDIYTPVYINYITNKNYCITQGTLLSDL